MKNGKSKKIYVVCIGAMFFLVVFAFYLPQGIVSMQDSHQMSAVETVEKAGQNILGGDILYETNMNERMTKFAALDKNSVTVVCMESDTNADVESILSQEWCEFLPQYMLAEFQGMSLVASEFEIENYQKCIVYGTDYREPVALLLWYIDLYQEKWDTRVQLVVDVHTNSIYYLKTTNSYKNNYYDNISAFDAVSITTCYEKEKLNNLYIAILMEIMEGCRCFYTEYYEAERSEEISMDRDHCNVKIPMFYGERRLDFEAEISFTDHTTMSVGITEIGDLVLKKIQN